MTKRPSSSRKIPKSDQRDPKDERRVIRRNPQADQHKLLKQDRTLKNEFDAADKAGTDALKRHDLPALRDAIEREGKAVDAHIRLIDKRRKRR